MNAAAYVKRAIRRNVGRITPLSWAVRRKKSLLILTYHRVLPKSHPERSSEQPGMCTAPEALAMHVRVLSQHFHLIDLGEWIDLWRSGKTLPSRACCVTFDDGWRDNYEFAFPILKAAGVPATVFLVSDFVGSEYEFWPNRLARLLRSRDGMQRDGRPTELGRLLRSLGTTLPTAGTPLTSDDVDRVIDACKAVPDEVMNQALDQVTSGAMVEATGDRRQLLDMSEIDEMRRSGLFRFGSHGRRHLRLIESLPSAMLQEEIVQSRASLCEMLGQSVDLFCYPNGDYCPDALELVRSVYKAAVTTCSGWNYEDLDPHLLRRQSLHDDISSDELCFLAAVGGVL